MATNTRNIDEYHGAVLIGQGGFGAVYRATDPDHGRDVAIKVLNAGIDETGRRRFDRERQTMGRLSSHPNIVPVYESGFTAEGEPFIVMELAEAGSLRDRLNTRGPVPWAEAVEIIAAIASAAQAAHEYGVLHRDIKPDNILIDHFANPKLTDFGIATVAGNITSTTNTTATLAHAAPEVFEGHPPTPAVDIYALGSTLVALITGRPPFLQDDSDTVSGMIGRILTQPPPDLRPYGLPEGLIRVIEQALAKDPAHRQATAGQLAAELRAGGSSGQSGAAPYVPMPTGQATQHVHGFVPPSAAPPGSSTPGAVPGPTGGYPVGPLAGGPQPTGGGPLPTGHGPFSAGTDTGVKRGGSSPLVVAVGAGLAIVALAGLAYLFVGGDDDTRTGAEGATVSTAPGGDDANALGPGTTGSSAGAGTIVEVNCPTEMPLNVETTCSIHSEGATGGEWSLPGFLVAPEDIVTVPGDHPIFIHPTDPAAVGRTFVITATVSDASGGTASVEHRFEVVGPTVEVNCPAEIALGESVVCEIVSANATSGQWSIPDFGNDVLEVVPGSNPIFIEPGDPSAVGQTFTITAEVSDDEGRTTTATADFVITG